MVRLTFSLEIGSGVVCIKEEKITSLSALLDDCIWKQSSFRTVSYTLATTQADCSSAEEERELVKEDKKVVQKSLDFGKKLISEVTIFKFQESMVRIQM